MAKYQKRAQVLMVFILIASLMAPALMVGAVDVAGPPDWSKIQPALVQIALESPEDAVRVIVYKAHETNQAEEYVESIGGRVFKNLGLINAFSAQLPAKAVEQLSQDSSVRLVSLDAPMISTAKPIGDPLPVDPLPLVVFYQVRDEFNLPAYANNDGTANWVSEWLEYDDDGLPETGQIFVDEYQRLHLENKDSGALESVQRVVDLSAATQAFLRFEYSGFGEGGLDIFAVEVSSDGTNFTTLETVEVVGNLSAQKGYVLTGMADFTQNFTIRFRLVQGFAATTQYIAIDNVQVEYSEQIDQTETNNLTTNVYLDTLGVQDVWAMGYTGAGVGVAVIDSGISNDTDLNLSARMSLNPNSNSVNDVYGHGTHVAGIIGGDGSGSAGLYQGVAPDIDLISLKISDEMGMAYESDTVDAMQWILDNKETYNIRVVNLSIQSAVEQPFNESALNAAVEILWFNGIVVTAATGNWYGGAVYPLNAAPANDPFVITVGATDDKGTTKLRDDVVASFSVWGYTQDGFNKPEIAAPGVDIISVLSKDSPWDVEHPDRVININNKPQYIRISGTSMATPMVSGAVALLLQAEPNLTPDQVKYRVINASNWVSAMPYLDVYQMLTTPTTESANQGVVPHILLAKMAMIAYWANAEGEENIDWENVDWAAVNWNAVNWNAVNWNAVNWNAVNWNAVNWNAVNWNAVNWNAVNWNAVNWNAVNWNAVNWNAVNWNAVNWNAVNWFED